MILDTVDVKKKGVHTRYLISVSYTHLARQVAFISVDLFQSWQQTVQPAGSLTASPDCVINRKLSWLQYQQGQVVPAS